MADTAIAAHQLGLVAVLQLANTVDAVTLQALCEGWADAPDAAHRQVSKKGACVVATQHREATRFVEVRGELGKELIVAEADRHRDPHLALDATRKLSQARRRWTFRPAQVEEGFVD